MIPDYLKLILSFKELKEILLTLIVNHFQELGGWLSESTGAISEKRSLNSDGVGVFFKFYSSKIKLNHVMNFWTNKMCMQKIL